MGIISFSPWNLRQINSPAGQQAGVTDGPAAAGDPFASVCGGQQHIVYLGEAGTIQDCWYDSRRGRWNHRQINGSGGVADGPAAAGNPFVWTADSEQQHFTYRDADGIIHDAWFAGDRFNVSQVNGAAGPAAAADPFASVFGNQQHIGYLDAAGVVYDAWHDGGRYNVQQINGEGGRTPHGPLAVGGPFVWTVGAKQQHFIYYDETGTIHDSYVAGGTWSLQHINGAGGLTDGPATAGLPFVNVYGDQQHVFYLGRTRFSLPVCDTGILHDAWFDSTKDRWNLRQINGTDGLIAGPDAAAGPVASVFLPRSPQAGQHVAYRDGAGAIYDAWFDSPATGWNLQQVTGTGGRTAGPPAVGGPFVWTVGADQQHFTYRTADGTIYDAWFNALAPPPAAVT
jgi:hypothetical protein